MSETEIEFENEVDEVVDALYVEIGGRDVNVALASLLETAVQVITALDVEEITENAVLALRETADFLESRGWEASH